MPVATVSLLPSASASGCGTLQRSNLASELRGEGQDEGPVSLNIVSGWLADTGRKNFVETVRQMPLLLSTKKPGD